MAGLAVIRRAQRARTGNWPLMTEQRQALPDRICVGQVAVGDAHEPAAASALARWWGGR